MQTDNAINATKSVLSSMDPRDIPPDHSILEKGFLEADVKQVLRLVDLNEYKRRQGPIGVRLTQRGFGRDRRYPITNGWSLGE